MKKSRLLSIVLCVTLILSGLSMTALAAGFDDVDNDPTVSWAKDSITKMTDAGYIKGYEDGTFRPYKAITKIECLILMSRMCGYEKLKDTDTVASAISAYGAITSKYNQTYSDELSYLLYLGVLKEADLADYASAANANTQLFRYQAAALMSKLMLADEEAKAYTVDTPTYSDNLTIPTNSRGYVEFVTANKIMNGMDTDADGRPVFSPITSLTRAQMATLLARMMDTLDYTSVSGTIEDISNNEIVAAGEEFTLLDCAKIYLNGETAELDELNIGDTVSIIGMLDGALLIEASSPEKVTTVYGVVVRKSENSSGQRITIADYEDTSISETYTLRSDCKILVDGTKGLFGDIMADDFVKLELIGAKVSELSTADTKLDVTGKLVSVDYDNDDHVYLNVGDENGENIQTYTCSIKGVKIARDEETAEFRDLANGDTVKLRLSYGKVTIVVATSTTETISGKLTEIILSSSPSVTITKDGVSKNFKVRSDAKITVAGENGDIYDLRPNVAVTVKLESSEVKSITASTVATNEKGELTGTVIGKNTSYNVITVEDADGNTHSVYYNSKTTFLTSNGSSTNYKSVEKGSTISVTGSEANGVFEATIVIIK